MAVNFWRPEEDRILLDARDNQRLRFSSISKLLTNRSDEACAVRYHKLKSAVIASMRCDLNEIRKPERAAEPTTITGRLLGDPPPGRSALDHRRAASPRDEFMVAADQSEGPRVTLAAHA